MLQIDSRRTNFLVFIAIESICRTAEDISFRFCLGSTLDLTAMALPFTLLQRSFLYGSLAVLLTAFLEVLSWKHVQQFKNKTLYRSALFVNVRNNIFLGALTYFYTIKYCTRPGPLSFAEQLQAAAGIVVIEAGLYYLLHKTFHENRSLYWIHSYHHKFNTIVLPSSANAVSIAEYSIAYMIPLVIGVNITQADETSAFLGAALVGITNLLIHTPVLEESYALPWMFVSTKDHMSHHSKNKGNYGAPILHVDRIVGRCRA